MKGVLIGVAVVAAALVGAFAAAVHWSGARLVGDPQALTRIEVQPFGGTVASARAFDAQGDRIPLSIHGGTVTPRARLRSGERVFVDVIVRRPGWLAWALGRQRRLRLSIVTPVATVADRWLIVAPDARLGVRFSQPVARVEYRLPGGPARDSAANGRSTVQLAVAGRKAAGTLLVAAAARTWERPAQPIEVDWFPQSHQPVVLAQPAMQSALAPAEPIRLTFSEPVSRVLGSAQAPVASLRGRWQRADSHTLVFTPTGLGADLGSTVRVTLPQAVAHATPGGSTESTRTLEWSVPAGSLLRLQQLLAEQGYLPLDWIPAGAGVQRTKRAEFAAAVAPPSGRFVWRYPNTPPELQRLWSPGRPNQVTRGAVMMFEHEHHLTVDALAGPHVWRALIADAVDGKHHSGGYSYVYVHRDVPQRLTLWHDGNVVLTSPGNTGVPAAPTQLGTWPVFEHIPVGTMSGTNPDGSHYHDPGIRWISYFHGGEALHEFPRANFGTPQSLGCVELPLAAAAEVWPYTPIGTLVTIES